MVIEDRCPGIENIAVQAVIVCVNFGDYLKETLPVNLPHFDNVIVVTDPKDRYTMKVCRQLSVQCIPTTDFYRNGDNFNKGRGINIGLANLRPGGWRLHMDADIVLPTQFKRMVAKHPLDQECIYGADRVNIHTEDAWKIVKDNLHHQYHDHYMVSPICGEGMSMASRFVHDEWGFCPIGFLQFWHSSTGVNYPTSQGTAAHTDVTFAIQFPLESRKIIPEIYVYHLEKQGQHKGQNWRGRRTKGFLGNDEHMNGIQHGLESDHNNFRPYMKD